MNEKEDFWRRKGGVAGKRNELRDVSIRVYWKRDFAIGIAKLGKMEGSITPSLGDFQM